MSDLTLGSDPDAELSILWSQELPRAGKRRLAGEVARAEIDVASEVLEATRLAVRAEVKTAYVDLFRIRRTRTILEESRNLLESFRDTARARYETGEGILENILKAQTELTLIDARLAELAQERRAVEVGLVAVLGRSSDARLGPAQELPVDADVDVPSIEAEAVERSPGLRALRSSSVREQRRVDLALENLKPDLVWSAGYTNRGGFDPMVMGAVGVRLPLRRQKKQHEAVLMTRLEHDAAERDVERGRVRLLSELREIMGRAERARTLMRLYDDGILPQARSALDAAAASYAVGRTEFLTVIDDFRAVLGYEIDYETQRADRFEALARLERLTGVALVTAGGPAGRRSS